jgi:hypothetical protein
MRRISWSVFGFIALLFAGAVGRAESSMDALEDDLKAAEQQHMDATSKQFSDLITALDKALQSSENAIELYQEAGGDMPAAAPVLTFHDSETPDEKAARDAQDQATNNALAAVVQLHCGIMRFAAYFVQHPDEKGLQDAWISWLKQAAQLYPQAGGVPPDNRPVPPPPGGAKPDAAAPAPKPKARKNNQPPDVSKMLKDKAVKDSLISAYLGYNGWGDREQGNWRVRDIPHLYRNQVLEPLRVKPSAATLAAWDVYIAMENADEPDQDKWTGVEYPSLQFQRGCDAFYAVPSDDRLETLVALIKNNPTHPELDQWIPQVKQMIKDYRTYKSTGTMPQPGDSSTSNTAPAGT